MNTTPKYTAIRMGLDSIAVERTADLKYFINPEILASGDDYHDVEMAACDVLDDLQADEATAAAAAELNAAMVYAIEAAECSATNADLLRVMLAVVEQCSYNAQAVIAAISDKHQLDSNNSFKRHMRNEFAYYSNITPRQLIHTIKMEQLELIWETAFNRLG